MLRIRILHCILSMGGGGAERQLTYLVDGLRKRDCEVHVAIFSRGPNLDRLQASGAIVHELGCKPADPRALFALTRLIRKIRPDIIQTWLLQMDVIAGIAAWLTRTPFVMSERCSEKYYVATNWKYALRTWVAWRAKTIIANSAAGQAYWSRKTHGRIVPKVISNIVPVEEIRLARVAEPPSLPINGLTQVILFAGRFDCDQKNLVNLMYSLRTVLNNRSQAVGILFGEGPDRDKLDALAVQFGFGDRLQIRGFNKQLWGWMKRANVFVSVSNYEGQPNTVLEAIACQCPLVVSDIPEHKEFLTEDCAYFVPADDPDLIARAVSIALSNPEEARQKSENALKQLSGLTADSIAAQYIEQYLSVLQSENPASARVRKLA